MTYLPTLDLYYNTQVYFRHNHMQGLANCSNVWTESYQDWLHTQGCKIIYSDREGLIRTGLGVAPGHDLFAFENQQDAIFFKLRWS